MINITKCRNIQSESCGNQNSRAKQQAKTGDCDRLCHILHLHFWCGFEISYTFSLMSGLRRELEFSNSFMHLKTALNIWARGEWLACLMNILVAHSVKLCCNQKSSRKFAYQFQGFFFYFKQSLFFTFGFH